MEERGESCCRRMKMIGHVECGGHEIRDAKCNEDWHIEHTWGPVWVTAWRLYQDAHAPCQQRANLRQGTGEGFLSFTLCVWIVFHLTHSLLPQLISALIRGMKWEWMGHMFQSSATCLMVFLLSFCFCIAAVDYLAKNVSLSTQRRMKLGDHSAVLGLLQVETGQAY